MPRASYDLLVRTLTLGVPRERSAGEKRVAVVPGMVAKLTELGFEVVVESGAGEAAGYADESYRDAGAQIAAASEAPYRDGARAAFDCDVVVKVTPFALSEVENLREGSVAISLVHPARHPELVQAMAKRGVTTIALDKIPRITRAQKMDVLSSMANLAGYRAVLEAAAAYQGFFGAQVTAAGTERPARILVIGAGVAGLAAIAAGRALGAEVRAFDVRAAAKEQVESLGGKFLTVELEESGEGTGGYAKTMSKEFIEAEMALFRAQAKEVDVIVTTALVPGAKAPILVPEDVVACLKPGSVVVDLAAEQGGNCALTKPGRAVVHEGVTILGYTDLPSRMASTASRFFGGNVLALLSDMARGEEGFRVDLEDEVVRAATLTHGGEELPPPPPPEPSPAAPKKETPVVAPKAAPPADRSLGTAIFAVFATVAFALVALYAPPAFVQRFTVFILACFVGWQVVWAVAPSLHTPLMSVTNAISGIVVVGGLLQAAPGGSSLAVILGLCALFVATVNVSGGFFVTDRMLGMFKKGGGR
ncbi:MAG: Re/Si-specific NAD(P)(+) transhydrogenase subunit alpha [Sandaracinus sp.]|nr:Re/Si-specific NAD(P)(+) transhydrogenase subunit alpha [Sandaracinus sp.]